MTVARVLVACEYSGRVRDAFRARGHDAWSCDLEPCEADPTWHHQGDVLPLLREPWDLVIAHPPCTYLTVSGNKWLKPEYRDRFPDRPAQREAGAAFFLAMLTANSPRIAVENPIGVMSTRYRKPDQVIQPWMFGHGEVKATCLWLIGLPTLLPTTIMTERRDRLHRLPPSPTRWKERSRTFQGIADAMADQWSPLLERPDA